MYAQGLEIEPKIYFALQEITSMAKDVWGRKGKKYKGQIVPLI